MYTYDKVEYDIQDTKKVLDEDTSVILISDLHDFTKNILNARNLAELIKREDPNHILIAGDLIKGIHWDNKKELNKLLFFLSNLSESCPVFVQVGNHDKMNMSDSRISNFNAINSARPGKTYLLLNDIIDYDKFRIVGYSSEYHLDSDMTIQKSGIAHNEFVKEFENNGPKLEEVKDRIVEFVGHNPHLIAQGYSENGLGSLKNVDMFATGNLHNGYFNFIKNRDVDKWLDSGYTQIPISRNIDGKINLKSIRPLYGKIGLCRGTVFIDEFANQKYLLLRNGNIYINISLDPINSDWVLVDQNLALQDIYDNNYKALVISGGVRKFFFLEPFDINVMKYSPEITKINYKQKILK